MSDTSPKDQAALLWNQPPAQPTKPRPGESLWSIRKGNHQIDAELRYHGEYGVEAQLLRDGELLIGRTFATKALAVQWANEERKALGLDGWT